MGFAIMVFVGLTINIASELERHGLIDNWSKQLAPLEELVQRGFEIEVFFSQDVQPDHFKAEVEIKKSEPPILLLAKGKNLTELSRTLLAKIRQIFYC